jgi:energy-coupling factor transporter ATP-binding protein EcfA2
MNKIYFISGVNGVGKSSLMPHLNSLLPVDQFEIHNFDERGVPENAGGEWRISETKYWVDLGVELTLKNKKIIVCGFVKLADFGEMLFDESLGITLIFLDASPEIIRQRLVGRYTKDGYFDETQSVIGKPINVFINGNIYISQQMKKSFEESNCSIVDTSNLIPAEVANRVAGFILNS